VVSGLIREAIAKLAEGKNLSQEEAYGSMMEIMTGQATPAQVAAFLVALRMKGETVEELTAFAKAMKSLCHKIRPNINGRLVDTCGTGGDKIKTFNVSTASAFIVAGAGVHVAKHGNRSVTSKSGSADVLECLGLNLETPPETVKAAIEQIGVGFMFAPGFHPAMKHAAGPRREIGIRTVFNFLGPLTNPASVDAQVLGVCEAWLVEKVAQVLKGLGLKEAMVVHGLDGLDEISTVGRTLIAWLRDGEIKTFEVAPEDLGVIRSSLESILCTGVEESAETTFQVVYGCLSPDHPKRSLVAVNAAAGLIVGGKAEDFAYGLELAQESIESGSAYKKLKQLVKFYDGSKPEKLEELEAKYG
jgi:anthranilate phosphoribosyltransferase